ncbi:MAG: 4Fe-4S ferredoxin, partial [Lachnospiraceae bacterium]|nr:4Fe-4S ferredoxin [Lachnospiraceae bacterium]
MKAVQITFSPTGGTDKVAETITKAWGIPVKKIDLANAETNYSSLSLEKDDIAMIAVPSYGGRVPSLAIQRISNIHGKQTPCVIVCVYG